MDSRPKTTAEILATAKKVPQRKIQSRKSKTERNSSLKDWLTTFTVLGNPNDATHETTEATSSASGPLGPGNVHLPNEIHFNEPITPKTLEVALEIREFRDEDNIKDLFRDEPPSPIWVFLFTLQTVQYITFHTI
jgi:hypothetical protein